MENKYFTYSIKHKKYVKYGEFKKLFHVFFNYEETLHQECKAGMGQSASKPEQSSNLSDSTPEQGLEGEPRPFSHG